MKSSFNTLFLISVLVLTGVLVYQIFKPFVLSLLLAFVFYQFFKDWYQRMLAKIPQRKGLLALLFCSLIFLIFFIPLVLISTVVVNQVGDFYQFLGDKNLEKIVSSSQEWSVPAKLKPFLGDLSFNSALASKEITSGLKQLGGLTLTMIKKTYEGAASFIFLTFTMFFALYYLFKDGEKGLNKIMELIPLKDKQEELLLNKFVSISKATLKGSLVIAILQGFLMGLAFWAAGVTSPAFWGLLTMVFSLIPLFGSGIIWFPAAIILFILGNFGSGLFILLFGSLVVASIDNFLRPKLVGRETSLHPLLVFFSTLGGIGLFGMIGFLVGPVILVLFISLLEIYRLEFKKELKIFNG
jgi:predicted PurR-regulated permease PerM